MSTRVYGRENRAAPSGGATWCRGGTVGEPNSGPGESTIGVRRVGGVSSRGCRTDVADWRVRCPEAWMTPRGFDLLPGRWRTVVPRTRVRPQRHALTDPRRRVGGGGWVWLHRDR